MQCPINLAYRGDFLSWVLNLPRSRFLVVGDDHLEWLAKIMGDLAHLEHVIVVPTGKREGPDPSVRWELFGEFADAPDTDPGVEVSWTDDARVMFTSGTTGRSKGAIKQHASDYFSGRTYNEVCGVTADDTFFSCLPLFHSNAQVLATYPALIAGARIAFSARYSSSRFWSQVIDAGGDHPEHGQRDQLLHLEHAPGRPRPRPRRVADHGHARAQGHLRRFRGALRHPLHRGLRPHRDGHGHLPPARRARAAGQLRRGDPRLRGDRRRAGDRPAGATARRPARSWST